MVCSPLLGLAALVSPLLLPLMILHTYFSTCFPAYDIDENRFFTTRRENWPDDRTNPGTVEARG